MKTNLKTSASVTIDADKEKVWKAITTPRSIEKYLMGTHVITDWKEGSPITYQGEHNGMSYKDKGTILKFEPGKIFQSTYWSSMGGKEDIPENYNTVTYQLEEMEGKTVVVLSQDNINTETEKEHATENWEMVLNKLKELVEG